VRITHREDSPRFDRQNVDTLLIWLSGGARDAYHSMWFEFGVPLGTLPAVVLLVAVFGLGADWQSGPGRDLARPRGIRSPHARVAIRKKRRSLGI
jgi:hypothetical protein